MLYLDVEGFEAVVLTGARQNLASRPDCVIEVHARTGLEKFGHAVADIRPFLPDDRYRRFVRPGGVEEFTGSSWPTIVSLTTGFFLMALARRSPPVDRE